MQNDMQTTDLSSGSDKMKDKSPTLLLNNDATGDLASGGVRVDATTATGQSPGGQAQALGI
jgi:hypothetical protein